MRGVWIAVALGLASASPGQAQVTIVDQGGAPAEARLDTADFEACIRENVSRVEAAIESLEDATAFLTTRLCAPIFAEAIRAARRGTMDARAARARAECENDERSGLIGFLTGYDACTAVEGYFEEYRDSPIAAVAIASQVPPEMTGLAAELLLQARLTRRAAEAQ